MKKNMKKMLILLAATMLLLTFAVGGTIAYLVTSDGPVVNTFEPAKVTIEVTEDPFAENDNIKNNVQIKNTGSAKAYIRAAIVVTWQDANGNIYPAFPVEYTDYRIDYGTGWTPSGGYYYYNGEVEPGDPTTNLINSIAPVAGRAPNGYDLHVEILAQAIQAEGGAVASATNWTITKPTN